ncbi:MAG: hypothetical protein DMH00_11725 [Acidobacteria bacterium]|nr:MAG: hypothetical protein DMH00_11725 [Acidobacteriota bacterium]
MLVNGPSDSCPALGSAPRLILLDRKNCSKTNYNSASYRLLHRGIPVGTILALVLAAISSVFASEGAASPPSQSVSDPAARLRAVLLGSSGQRIICPGCPVEAALRVDATSGEATEILLPYERVNALAAFPSGAATSSEKGKRSQLRVLSAESLAPLGRVEIPGNGQRGVVSPDGYTVYVLSQRPDRGQDSGSETGLWSLLAVDLGTSSVASSYPLVGAAYDLVLRADGGKIFVGVEDKILTFTTSPLTASWFYRSPGKNLRLAVRPRVGEIYSLRGSELAIFPPEPRKQENGGGTDGGDDATRVLKPPTNVNRFGFSPDGRFAVGWTRLDRRSQGPGPRTHRL